MFAYTCHPLWSTLLEPSAFATEAARAGVSKMTVQSVAQSHSGSFNGREILHCHDGLSSCPVHLRGNVADLDDIVDAQFGDPCRRQPKTLATRPR
jgi:hypothetical protein